MVEYLKFRSIVSLHEIKSFSLETPMNEPLTPDDMRVLRLIGNRSLLRSSEPEIEGKLERLGLISMKLGGYGITDRGALRLRSGK